MLVGFIRTNAGLDFDHKLHSDPLVAVPENCSRSESIVKQQVCACALYHARKPALLRLFGVAKTEKCRQIRPLVIIRSRSVWQ